MGNAPSFTLGGKSIVPFKYAFSTHGHNLSAAFRQHHSKCVFDTWCFLRQGLLQRNDVTDIITIIKKIRSERIEISFKPLIVRHALAVQIAQEGTFRTNSDGVAMASQSLMTPPF